MDFSQYKFMMSKAFKPKYNTFVRSYSLSGNSQSEENNSL